MSVCKAVEKKEAHPEPIEVVKNSQDVKSATFKVSQVKELSASKSEFSSTRPDPVKITTTTRPWQGLGWQGQPQGRG